MPNNQKVRLTPPSSEQPEYEVGYGRPPKASRFTPGQSGNLKGRPKGARNKRPGPHEERLKDIVIEEAYRTIKVSDGKRQITVPMAKAVIRSLAINAARGQLRSQQVFTKMLSETERALKVFADRTLELAIDHKVRWEQELVRRERLGVTGPEPIPHPDDIHIDVRTGQVSIKGPVTKEEKAEWDGLYDRGEESDRRIERLNIEIKKIRSKPHRSFLEDALTHERRVRQIIVNMVGEPSQRRRK